METAIRYLYTAYRASITALRVEATARKIGETDSFRLKCTVRNLSDEPADLRSLRLLIKGADGTFSSLPGWTFDVGGKRVTNAKPHVVTVVGKGLPEGVSLDELYVDLRGEVRGVPDSGWRRVKVGETEFKIVRNPRAGTDLVKKGGPVDVIVVLDTTGSMQGSIDSMRENAIRSIQRLQTITTDIRMAITTFRDLKDEDGSSHFTVKGFTLELENQYNFLRSLDADGGGDTPEDQLHGISLGLALWEKEGARKRVPTKVIIVITDAPAKSPDSKGNTFKSIAKRAIEVDPAHIYPIVVGTNSTALEHAQELADSSGGKVLTAATSDSVADAILEAVETAVAEHGVEEPDEGTPLGLVAMFVVGSVAFLFGAITLLGTLRR
jgi:Mg-chelatase subunit ChlD